MRTRDSLNGRENVVVFFWHQSEARTAATVWNWSGKTLSPGALLAVLYFSSFHIYFSARLDFPSPPLSAPWVSEDAVWINLSTYEIKIGSLVISNFELYLFDGIMISPGLSLVPSSLLTG